jgi:tripartite-type tricarboxylate transporter receptor subunit TctC
MPDKPITRRRLGQYLGTAAGAALVGSQARAASHFPNHMMNFIIPFGPGGDFDAYGREFAMLLQQQLKVNVEPVNLAGAGGDEAIFQLYHYPPDGYNISLISVPGALSGRQMAGSEALQLTWLANLGRDPLGLAVATHSPIKTIADLQKLGRKRPVKLPSTGKSATMYFANEVLSKALDMPIQEITGFDGSISSMMSAVRGEVDAVVQASSAIQELVSAGLVRQIFTFEPHATTPGMEDATSIGVPDLGKIYQYRPVVAPPGLPQDIADLLTTCLIKATRMPGAQTWARQNRTLFYPLGQQDTTAMIRTQVELLKKWDLT